MTREAPRRRYLTGRHEPGLNWRADAAEMVKKIVDHQPALSQRVRAALSRVPRQAFLDERLRVQAWDDCPLPIGAGQTISAPHMVAIMLETLDVQPGQRVLEIGTGSGYHAALLAELTGPSGQVDSLEVVPTLAAGAKRRLDEIGYDNVAVHEADGGWGWEENAPYDRISVAAACPGDQVPIPLKRQLAVGGRLVAPLGAHQTQLACIVRTEDDYETSWHGGCRFVPLTGSYG